MPESKEERTERLERNRLRSLALRAALNEKDRLQGLINGCIVALTNDDDVPRLLVDQVRDLLEVPGISVAYCHKRTVYRVQARNFHLAVHAGNGIFIGIRDKFGSRFLFEEYHRDISLRFGTVTPLEAVGTVPPNIGLRTDDPLLFSWLDREELREP